MKKYFYIFAALSLASNFASAQSFEHDVDAELDQLYSGNKESVMTSQSASARERAAISGLQQQQPANMNGSQPIYILNSAPSTSTAQVQAAQVQKQPTTVIEASPLSDSRAEQIRKTRQDVEVQTELKIVEKLEQSRMDDEKRRANVLFDDKFEHLNNAKQEVLEHEVIHPRVAPIVEHPVIVEKVKVQRAEEIRENAHDVIRDELVAAERIEEIAPRILIESRYMSAMAGVADLPGVRNVRGNYSLGAAFGNRYEAMIFEGAFQFSNYTVDQGASLYNYSAGYYPLNVNVNQYSGQVVGKFQVFTGLIRPVLGALMSYSYRSFTWANNNSGYSNGSVAASSHAIDIGAVAGVDLEFSRRYSLGFDFRYLWNLASRVDSAGSNWLGSPQYGTPIEKLQYYVMSVVGRVNF
jgi:hypothetical protein